MNAFYFFLLLTYSGVIIMMAHAYEQKLKEHQELLRQKTKYVQRSKLLANEIIILQEKMSRSKEQLITAVKDTPPQNTGNS